MLYILRHIFKETIGTIIISNIIVKDNKCKGGAFQFKILCRFLEYYYVHGKTVGKL